MVIIITGIIIYINMISHKIRCDGQSYKSAAYF